MIYQVKGKLISKNKDFIVLEVGRVGLTISSTINTIKEINNKILNELNNIFQDNKLLEPTLNYFNEWPYKLINYDLETLVEDGVYYDIFIPGVRC